MYKALPFIESTGRDEYKEVLSQPFQIGMIGLVDFKVLDHIEPLFKNWRGKNMVSWTKFENDNKVVVEFYGNKAPYKIINPKLVLRKDFTFPFPDNINQFICDCSRCNIDLQWNDYSLKLYDIKNMVIPEDFKFYINELLTKLGKI
jgi:hypothetical protein